MPDSRLLPCSPWVPCASLVPLPRRSICLFSVHGFVLTDGPWAIVNALPSSRCSAALKVPCLGASHHATGFGQPSVQPVAPDHRYSRSPLPLCPGPCHDTCCAPTTKPSHPICSSTMCAGENGGPTPLPIFQVGRAGRHGGPDQGVSSV